MVNAWKGRIKEFVVQNCHVCLTGARETVLHQLWECKSAHDAWARGSHVIDRVVPRLDTRAPPPRPPPPPLVEMHARHFFFKGQYV
jgi:hypothetical protein